MRKILVPIAHFESCQAALELGGRLSRALGADLTILHVTASASGSHLGSGVAAEKLAEWGMDPPQFKILQQALERLRGEQIFELDDQGKPVERHSLKVLTQGLFERHLLGSRGQHIRFRLREGKVVREILQEAEDPLYDLIITGTRGHRGLKRLLVGSVAQEVALRAPCSMLVAKNLKPSQRLLVGVTGRETSHEAVRQAGLLAQALDVPVSLLAVAPDQSEISLAEQHITAAIGILHDKSIRIESKILSGEPSAILLSEAGEAHLIVLGRLRRTKVKEMFLGDLSLRILDQSAGPVLLTSFPRSAPEETLEELA